MQTAKALGKCPGRSESLLGAQSIVGFVMRQLLRSFLCSPVSFNMHDKIQKQIKSLLYWFDKIQL